ncbi:MAG: V-type ATP synthase subunit D [Ruminococcaceae bacterium]|nr:V-type ATP synthase subunit D [Oscillospiraceae bacterium]
MAQARINPTRMELTKLKKRLKTARRGHKLLKDKCDELMKQFLEIVKKNMELRVKVEESLKKLSNGFDAASAVMSSRVIEESLMLPKLSAEISVDYKNIMSVNTPVFDITTHGDASDIYSYGFAFTSGELDSSVEYLSEILPDMLKLAEYEKTSQLLADEIEKTRRRVNALEYIMIPGLMTNIKNITMKLEENERGNITRLMKVKDMMIQQQLEMK